ncbi:phosphotransferase [Ruania alkalisoli]|uniref:Phosphotransferase n=1 Tax=Ruania alkalisoli TaxID=2779775 RepID=A0A7M1T079_9MICO|nr:phosphotransferase [Ruania alkalisoli]QOR72293.1 phosphotransferase [Ruania alkalisoli]
MSPNLAQVRALLERRGFPTSSVQPLEGGAWSTAFAFDSGQDALILRLGGSTEDYEADAFIARLRPDGVPIPDVLAHGTIDSGPLTGTTYAISARVPGTALERVSRPQWSVLVPQLADILESLRHTPAPAGHRAQDWRDHLLQVGSYPWQEGWRERAVPAAVQLFDHGLDRLRTTCPVTVPVSLVHADWINRNVHVEDGRITGIFDWGCYRFGDHLYDLAWLEFWAPWHRNLDLPLLVRELESRWHSVGIAPLADPDRRRACLLHIGLDHIIYNILHGTTQSLLGTMNRLAHYL